MKTLFKISLSVSAIGIVGLLATLIIGISLNDMFSYSKYFITFGLIAISGVGGGFVSLIWDLIINDK